MSSLSLSGVDGGARDFYIAGFCFVAVKLAAAVAQIASARGDYRSYPNTWTFRIIYVAGKTTPALAGACFCIAAYLSHDARHVAQYGIAAVGVALLAMLIVRLRKQGRFYGVFHLLSIRDRGGEEVARGAEGLEDPSRRRR